METTILVIFVINTVQQKMAIHFHNGLKGGVHILYSNFLESYCLTISSYYFKVPTWAFKSLKILI